MSKNDITGDEIKTGAVTNKYRDNYEAIFGKKKEKTFRQKWLDALRSGDYEQASGCLTVDGKYCCLGVACDLHESIEWVEEDGKMGHMDGCIFTDAMPPRNIMEELGLQDINRNDNSFVEAGVFNDWCKEVGLDYSAVDSIHVAIMNDELEMSFSEIADAVEALFPVEDE